MESFQRNVTLLRWREATIRQGHQIEAKFGNGHNCWEGLNAEFRNGKLIQLTYRVDAEGGPKYALNQVVLALTAKFGKPEPIPPERGTAAWLRGKEILFLRPLEQLPVGQGKPKVNLIIVGLGAVEDNAKKDI